MLILSSIATVVTPQYSKMDNDGGQLILENFMSLQNMISTKTRYFWFGRATVVDQKWLPELSVVEMTKKNVAELFEIQSDFRFAVSDWGQICCLFLSSSHVASDDLIAALKSPISVGRELAWKQLAWATLTFYSRWI